MPRYGLRVSIGQPTVVHAFMAAVDARPDQPLITFYDDATGERAELSGATLANWVAKTANLLVDGLGLGPGDTARVQLPPHWQSAAVLLGCWAAGLTVDLSGQGDAAVAFVAPPSEPPPAEPPPAADEVFALALAPFGLPFRPGPPPGTTDFVVEMRPHGDRMPPIAARAEQIALRPEPRTGARRGELAERIPHAELVAEGVARAVPPAARILIDADVHPDPATWLVAPLVAGASVVLCRHLDPDQVEARLVAERATPFPPVNRRQ